jgi:deoxyribonuclease-4
MWRATLPLPADVARFREARERFDLYPLAIHVNYLINLASLDSVIREKSIAAFRGELERALLIGAEYLVTHPGNYKSCNAEEGIAAFVLGLEDAARDLKADGLSVLMENTVGAGCQLGGKFSELGEMRRLAERLTDFPIGYCLDTCHLLASGFDIQSEEGLEQTIEEAERELGLENVKIIHANDSKGALGSRLDRHANIGEGAIGEEGFRRILRHAKLREKPFILETPVDEEGDDLKNVDALKRLAAANGEVKAKRKSPLRP